MTNDTGDGSCPVGNSGLMSPSRAATDEKRRSTRAIGLFALPVNHAGDRAVAGRRGRPQGSTPLNLHGNSTASMLSPGVSTIETRRPRSSCDPKAPPVPAPRRLARRRVPVQDTLRSPEGLQGRQGGPQRQRGQAAPRRQTGRRHRDHTALGRRQRVIVRELADAAHRQGRGADALRGHHAASFARGEGACWN